MKILALDTSSAVATVAVAEDNRLLGEYFLNSKAPHSKKLMPMVAQLLQSLELTPFDIDVYAVGAGPGSFTGLRIGVAAVKAMAQAVGKPCAAVSVLEALAYNMPHCKQIVCPILDARNNQVYCGVYRHTISGLETLIPTQGIALAELLEQLKATGETVIFLGDGVPVHRTAIEAELGGKCSFAPLNCNMQRASSVALAAMGMAERGRLVSAHDLVPEYLRKPQAEREREKRNSV